MAVRAICPEICCHPYRNSDGQHRRTTILLRKKSKKPLADLIPPPISIAKIRWNGMSREVAPPFPRSLREGGPLGKRKRRDDSTCSLHNSRWPLNCSGNTNCRRARVTLPVMSYPLSNVRASQLDAYRLWAGREPVAPPQ